MTDQLFNVIFRGDIIEGNSLVDVKSRMAQLFKLDAAKVDGMFTGKPVILKKACDAATAEKFKTVLTQTGALVSVKPFVAEGAAAAVPTAPTPPPRPPITPAVLEAKPVTPVINTPTPAAQTASPVVPAAPTTQQPLSADNMTVASVGLLVREGELAAPAPVDVNIDHLKVVRPKAFSEPEPLQPTVEVQAPNVDLTNYKMERIGPLLHADEIEEFIELDIDLSHLDIAATGADILSADELPPEPPRIAAPDFDIAPAGSDVGEIQKAPSPPAPDTSHIKLV